MATVITVSGKAESGKDFCSKILKKELERLGKKVLIVHYADYLKFIATQYFGWNGEKDVEGRRLLQWLGTDVVRKRYPDFWVETVSRLLIVFSPDFDFFLIPDTRFPNEIDKMMDCFNVISVKINRINYENTLTPEQRNHASETSLDDYPFDCVVEAESGVEKATVAVRDFITNCEILQYEL